jgi:hypothetical protein
MGHLLKLKDALETLECAYLSFNKCPIYIHDGANVKFRTNSDETDYSIDAKTSMLMLVN